jgi:circadian clock protein KaiC
MLGGGFFRGSSVLVSGTAGTGKSSLSAHFADATCRRGEPCLVFAFEEAQSQIIRNMRSIGIDLDRWVKAGKLAFLAERPTSHGLENHLAAMHRAVRTHRPRAVIFDPLTNLLKAGTPEHATSMLTRLIDFLKSEQITAVFTSLTQGGAALDATELGVSSLMDTWIILRDLEVGGERNRVLHLVKSRGMSHSNQVREFLITSQGVDLCDVYLGPGGVLTGSLRLAQEAADQSLEHARQATVAERQRQLERRRLMLEAQIAALRAKLSAEEAEVSSLRAQEEARLRGVEAARRAMASSRQFGNTTPAPAAAKPRASGRRPGVRKGGVR